MAYPAKSERNKRIFSDYLGGMSRAKVAGKYGLSVDGLDSLLQAHDIKLPKGEAIRRAQAMRGVKRGGRKPVWPDCPAHLQDEYKRLQKSYQYTAAEARRMLEGGA